MLDNLPRITSGDFKNFKLKISKNASLKFVRDKVRQAIFMILQDRVLEADILDLFAGTGILGFEALSRGAYYVDFVEENYNNSESLKHNINQLKLDDRAEVHKTKAITFAGNTEKKYDLIFVDPFYDDVNHKFLLSILSETLKENGVVIFLHGGLDIENQIKTTDLRIALEREYGKTKVTFLKHLKNIDKSTTNEYISKEE
jgi:16S rRNA (guanine(966)-N(2))-methyltransferase RsmD